MKTIYNKDGNRVETDAGKVFAILSIPNDIIRREAKSCSPLGHGFHGDVEGKKRALMSLPPGKFPAFPREIAGAVIMSSFEGSLARLAGQISSKKVTMEVGDEFSMIKIELTTKAKIDGSAIRPNDPNEVAQTFVKELLRPSQTE